jgi:hypothetical protein
VRATKEQVAEILELQEELDREEQARGRVYEKYGSPGEDLIRPIGELAELAKMTHPEAMLELLKEFLR